MKSLLTTALLLGLFFLSSCSRIPEAPQLANQEGYLTAKTTRQLLEHWAGNGYPTTVSGRAITFKDRHPALPNIAGFTPADSISKDSRDRNALGSVVMAHTQTPPEPLPITPRAWQITSQPATIVARAQADGSIQLTARDFRDEPEFAGRALATNYRLPFDYIQKEEDNPIAKFLALIDPTTWSERRGFYLAAPYDSDKIPLIFIHGLLSTPMDFEGMASAIAAEPDLWDRYQFWFYFYPTGNPWVTTAAQFREEFRELVKTLDPEGDDRPLREDTTIIAHSMGGLISRLSLSEQPETLYRQYFNRPLNDLRLPPYQKKRLREQLLFEPLEEPSRIIFLATPHKGSRLAGGPLLWLARTLVKAPARIIDTTLNTAQLVVFAEPGLLTQNGYDLIAGNEVSVNGLHPGHPALVALETMPIRKGVQLDNIVASVTGTERGLGDWVVPLKSARLKSADTETIVRSGHWLIADPETHREVIRLLRQ